MEGVNAVRLAKPSGRSQLNCSHYASLTDRDRQAIWRQIFYLQYWEILKSFID